MQNRLDGRSAGNVQDFIDGCLGGFDQAQDRQQKLPFLPEQFGQGPAVCTVDDLLRQESLGKEEAM
jgi:hypothetical protein